MNNIVLCGFMGCGKSSVGRLVAKRLGLEFIDTDDLCEKREGMSIPEMFERMGEDGFRDAEYRACAEVASVSGKVIATGGGALTFERNKALFKNDTVVFLNASFDEIEKRIGGKGGRPLFKDINKAKELYISRIEHYLSAADIIINSDKTADEVATELIDRLP